MVLIEPLPLVPATCTAGKAPLRMAQLRQGPLQPLQPQVDARGG
jgi:hypothetical protein